MSRREERIQSEARALWRELYGEAPPAGAQGGDMLDLMLSRLPNTNYDRLNSPFLRAAGLSRPKGR
jgi:hypothetical protein